MSGVPEIRKGSKCRARTSDEEIIEGEFLGYTMLGSENAAVLMMEGGITRFLILSNISYLDLMAQAPGEEEKGLSGRRADIYYG